jgi:hypothetical protein
MPEPELVESVHESAKPFRNLLAGIGIPLAVMASCAGAGAGLASVIVNAQPETIKAAVAFGALLGFFVSFYGIAELLIATFFSSGPGADRLCRAAGYLVVWAAAAGVLLWVR